MIDEDDLFRPDGKTHAPGCCVHFPGGGCDCYLSWTPEERRAMLGDRVEGWMEQVGDESSRPHKRRVR